MDGLLFTMLLGKVLNKLWKFLLNMDPMFIFKLKFSFSFWFWFSFLFLCFFSFLYLLIVGSLFGGCFICWLIVSGCVVWYFILFLFFFLNNFFFLLKDGKTALHIAAERGLEQIVKILVEHGSNVDLQEKVLIFFFFFYFHFDFYFFVFFLISLFVDCGGSL